MIDNCMVVERSRNYKGEYFYDQEKFIYREYKRN